MSVRGCWNKLFNKKMTEQWEEWKINGGGVKGGFAKTQTRKQVAEWIVGTYNNISEQTAQNAWKKRGYQWFLG